MRMPVPPAALLLIGLGLGAIGRAYVLAASWIGLILVIVGIGLAIASGPRAPADQRAGGRPTLQGLGDRVEQILRLAEEQANDRRAMAKREAERIVADARAEARAITESAGEQAP